MSEYRQGESIRSCDQSVSARRGKRCTELINKLPSHSFPVQLNQSVGSCVPVHVHTVGPWRVDIVNTMVKGFNGRPVNNLSEMARMVEACKQEYLRFELAGTTPTRPTSSSTWF